MIHLSFSCVPIMCFIYLDLSSRYPYMLTMGGYAMTFPFCMKTTSKGLSHRQSYMEEKAKAGTDSAKINLRAVSYKCEYLSCFDCITHSNL